MATQAQQGAVKEHGQMQQEMLKEHGEVAKQGMITSRTRETQGAITARTREQTAHADWRTKYTQEQANLRALAGGGKGAGKGKDPTAEYHKGLKDLEDSAVKESKRIADAYSVGKLKGPELEETIKSYNEGISSSPVDLGDPAARTKMGFIVNGAPHFGVMDAVTAAMNGDEAAAKKFNEELKVDPKAAFEGAIQSKLMTPEVGNALFEQMQAIQKTSDDLEAQDTNNPLQRMAQDALWKQYAADIEKRRKSSHEEADESMEQQKLRKTKQTP